MKWVLVSMARLRDLAIFRENNDTDKPTRMFDPTCVYEQFNQLTICHQELGDQVHVPVPATTIGLIRGWHSELGEEVLQGGQGGGLPTVIFIPGQGINKKLIN